VIQLEIIPVCVDSANGLESARIGSTEPENKHVLAHNCWAGSEP